jgi:hypothetical protein
MPPQAAAAAAVLPDESPEVLPKQEASAEAKAPENPIEKALGETNPEKVVSIFKGRASEEKKALELLSRLEPVELDAAPVEALQVKAANDNADRQITEAEEKALQEVGKVMPAIIPSPTIKVGEAAPEIAAPEIATAEATVEAVKIMPILKVGEVPNASPEVVHDAEEQRDEAEDRLVEARQALGGFAKEHDLTVDTTDPNNIKVSEKDLTKLSDVERSYVYTIIGRYLSANTSQRHAEKLLEAYSVPESDPKRAMLMAEAQSLGEEARLKGVAAQIMQDQYTKLPEIAALAGGGGGESTGGSMGGGEFHAVDSPYAGKPPQKFLGAPLYTGGGTPAGGVATIDALKTQDAKVTKEPSWIDKKVRGWFSALTFGWIKDKH